MESTDDESKSREARITPVGSCRPASCQLQAECHRVFDATKAKIEMTLPSRGGRTRKIVSQDFEKEAAIFLPEKARYDYLADLPEGEGLGGAINQAMRLIED